MADVVIEAVVESENVKTELFLELDKIVKSSAILASNTSSISITRLASSTSRPSQVTLRFAHSFILNLHFKFELDYFHESRSVLHFYFYYNKR